MIEQDVLFWRRKVLDAIINKSFPQQQLMWPSLFQDHCKKRGIGTSIGTSVLEKWDKMGVFHPVCRYLYPTKLHRKTSDDGWHNWESEPIVGEPVEGEEVVCVVQNGWQIQDVKKPLYQSRREELLKVPTVDNFSNWKEYEQSGEYYRTSLGGVYYHPFQILRLRSVTQACLLRCSFFDFQVSGKLEEIYRNDLQQALETIKKNEVYELKVLYLLCLVEDRYLPKWRGERRMLTVTNSTNDKTGETWHNWAADFDAKAILQLSGFSGEEIQKMRFDLAFHGECLDVNKSFYLLFRHLPYKERQKLSGDALLAWDYYEAAEILGWFLEDATGERQPKTDDLNGYSDWKKAFYGVEPQDIDYDEGNIIKALLQDYAIDPTPKVLLVVEGESEAAFIKTWCEERRIRLELQGVRLLVLEGIPGLNSKTTEQALLQAKIDKTAIVVVVDDENDARKQLGSWVSEGLIARIFQEADLYGLNSPIGGMIWSPCFEDANFTLEEQIQAWLALAREQRDVNVDIEEIRSKTEEIFSQPQLNKKGEVIKLSNNMQAMDYVHRKFGLLKPSDNKPGFARHLALLHGNQDTHIRRIIEHCCRIALLANLYGPAQLDGGFGKPADVE